jgi:hypothetical protein
MLMAQEVAPAPDGFKVRNVAPRDHGAGAEDRAGPSAQGGRDDARRSRPGRERPPVPPFRIGSKIVRAGATGGVSAPARRT